MQSETPARAAPSAARSVESDPIDPDLATVIDAWPSLPKPVKAGIVALVNTAIESR
ncbi:MAG: hypothetical protein O7F17_03720 [Planctomycetota bacterium]|nr:hypothetical protein [Planctomycetota bacterium]MCZ6850727.1 hypothetical protein [Planctomycetota bacterium]